MALCIKYRDCAELHCGLAHTDPLSAQVNYYRVVLFAYFADDSAANLFNFEATNGDEVVANRTCWLHPHNLGMMTSQWQKADVTS